MCQFCTKYRFSLLHYLDYRYYQLTLLSYYYFCIIYYPIATIVIPFKISQNFNLVFSFNHYQNFYRIVIITMWALVYSQKKGLSFPHFHHFGYINYSSHLPLLHIFYSQSLKYFTYDTFNYLIIIIYLLSLRWLIQY